MRLEGSCHCRAVRFEVQAREPVPYLRCYCSICRKTAGSGGYAINLGADFRSLQVQGREHLGVYRAVLGDGSRSSAERHFCRDCGSALWVWDPRWPDLVHPHAGAVDTPLPEPPHSTHIMLGSKPAWAQPHLRDGDETFNEYPHESLADWHRRHKLTSD